MGLSGYLEILTQNIKIILENLIKIYHYLHFCKKFALTTLNYIINFKRYIKKYYVYKPELGSYIKTLVHQF